MKDGPGVPLERFKFEDKRWRDLPIVGVRCAQRLPADAAVKVVIGPQVKTRTGIERKTPQALAFKDGKEVRADRPALWLPDPGRREVVLRAANGQILDRVRFEVRGLQTRKK